MTLPTDAIDECIALAWRYKYSQKYAESATAQLEALKAENEQGWKERDKWRHIAKMFASLHIEIEHAMTYGADDFYGLVMSTKYNFDNALGAYDKAITKKETL